VFLGGFLLGQMVRLSIVWTPAPGEPAISATSVLVTHVETGETIGPLAAALSGGEWVTTVEPTKRGTWRCDWATTPDGGVYSGRIYVS
jgi:hypothetical protein